MNELENNNDNKTIRGILVDIEQLITILTNELDQNLSTNLTSSLSPSTITNVTIIDDSHRIIEHLHYRIKQLEYERNVLLTSYQLLIKLLK